MSPAPHEGSPSAGAEPVSRKDVAPPTLVQLLASFHRLLKVARMYDKNNRALATSAEAVVAATALYCEDQATESVDLMFANETVFVNGRMLPMPRDVYERVMELGAVLLSCDIANVHLERGVSTHDLVSFVHALGSALRDPSIKGALREARYGGVRARPLRWRAALAGEGEQSAVDRVLTTYASAVVLLRRFYAGLDSAETAKIPLSIRRIAQRLVSHAEEEAPFLIALAAARNLGSDEAALAVTAALVSILMARQLTTDRAALTDLALAALLHDLGRRRLLALRNKEASGIGSGLLGDDEKARLAASDALSNITLEGIHDLAMARTVISFEAHWQTHRAKLGPLYGGKRPVSVPARILSVARAFSELMAPGSHRAMGAEDAIQFLAQRATEETQRQYIKLLRGGLAIFAAGTAVELSTGEIAVVTRVPDNAVDFPRPPVRIMYDAGGNALEVPKDVDLGLPTPKGSGPPRSIRRALDMDAQQAQAMRAFVLSVTQGDASARAKPEVSPPASASAPRRGDPEGETLTLKPRTPVPIDVPPDRPPPSPSAVREARPRFVDSRSEEGWESARAVDVVAPRSRPRTNPGPLSSADATWPSSRPRTKPGAPLSEVVGPRERPRTNPTSLAREDTEARAAAPATAAPSTAAGVPPNPPGRVAGRRERTVFVDPRTEPEESAPSASPPHASAAPHKHAAPKAPAVPRPEAPEGVHAAPTVLRVWGEAAPEPPKAAPPKRPPSKPHAQAAATGPKRRSSKEDIHAAPTVARSWTDPNDSLKPAAPKRRSSSKRDIQAAPTVATSWTAADAREPKTVPPKRKSSKVNVQTAPTVARSWTTGGADSPKPAPPRRKSSKLTQPAAASQLRSASSRPARPAADGSTEKEAATPGPKRRPSTTRKANWGDYGALVSKATQDEGAAARPTRRLKAERGETRKPTPDPEST